MSGGSSPQIPQGIGYSPGPNTPNGAAGSGHPAFRTLRSLLLFGPNKDGNQTKSSTSTPRSPFSSFGSVKKSVARERDRKMSLSEDALAPVIAIERPDMQTGNDSAIRRSVSLSRLEKPLPREPSVQSLREDRNIDDILGSGTFCSFEYYFFSDPFPAYQLRTPSPGPPLAAELSTILEADNSGVSKVSPDEVGQLSSPPLIIVRDYLHPNRRQNDAIIPVTPDNRLRPNSADEVDMSALNLSTSEVANDVRDALRRSTGSSQSGEDWKTANKVAVIIDADEHPEVADRTFNMDGVDSDLMSLLNSSRAANNESVHSPVRSFQPKQTSPSTPTFPPSPSSYLSDSRRAPSFLPRLRPSNPNSPSPTPTSSHFSILTPSPTTATMSTITTPKPSPSKPHGPAIAVNGSDYSLSSPPVSPSSQIPSISTSTPMTNRRLLTLPQAPRMFRTPGPKNQDSTSLTRSDSGKERAYVSEPSNASRAPTRTLREVMLGAGSKSQEGIKSGDDSPSPASYARTTSIPLGRGSLDSGRAPSSSSYANEIGLGRPSLEIRRPSSSSAATTFDSRTRPSLSRHATSSRYTSNDRAMSEADLSFSAEIQRDRGTFEPVERPSSAAAYRVAERRNPSPRVSAGVGGRSSPAPRATPPERIRRRSMSVQERIAKGKLSNGLMDGNGADNGVDVGSAPRPGSSLSVLGARGSRGIEHINGTRHERSPSGGPGPKAEWLGPRTAKAFKAAGLLDFEKEKEKEARDVSGRLRDRSGSVGGTPSPTSLSTGLMASRFSSMRSASDYNPGHTRALSRMAFSESGGGSGGVPGRRGSGSYSAYGGSHGGTSPLGYNGLIESPTFTVSTSSRDRETFKSPPSTAPTSVSESFGYLGRDRQERDRERERDREELRDLKEKHATEMAALLSALSDSQRTARVLRDENSQLRDRLEDLSGLVQDNENLRHAYDSVDRECISLRRELSALRAIKAPGMSPSWSGSSGTSSFRTIAAKGSPLAMDSTPRYSKPEPDPEEEQYNDTVIIHNSIDDNPRYLDEDEGRGAGPSNDLYPPSSTSTPVKRRLSNTSSIFPIPPPNMTMLLHDEMTSQLVSAKGSSVDQSQYPLTFISPHHNFSNSTSSTSTSHSQSHYSSQPISYRNGTKSGHALNQSINSTTSISPTTANFSMTTGSPGSLRLRPEHELLLGDMESLDLGARSAGSDSSNL